MKCNRQGSVLDSQESKIASALSALRTRYMDRLPMELAELHRLAQDLDGKFDDRTQLQTLHHRLHKLSGSGGTFGFTELSNRARQLELTAKDLLAKVGQEDIATPLKGFAEEVSALSSAIQAMPTEMVETVKPTTTKDAQLSLIWLLEHEQPMAQELKSQLEQFGYQVRSFQHYADALQASTQGHPDFLVLGDAFLDDDNNSPPDSHPPAFTQIFHCPFAFISSHDSFAFRVRAARLGAAGFLLKPLDVPRLVSLLERVQQTQQNCNCRVLVVDDDENLSEHFRLVLMRAGMDVRVLSQPRDILQHLSEFRPELVLLDINMPEFSGQDLAATIRQYDEWVSLPIVYLSAETDLDKQLQALGHGADDFLTKPISDSHLVAAVKVRVARSRQLADLVSKDSLTGLLKHARIKEELNIELDRATREGRPLSVSMLDIDHFKLVNDTYGHAMGDRVIQAIAHVLRQRLRKSDKIGRYGGEEFAIVLPGCDSDLAYSILEDIRERFAALSFVHLGKKFQCTLSAGIACNQQLPSADGNQLLNAADEALYKAKRANRNQVQIAKGPQG